MQRMLTPIERYYQLYPEEENMSEARRHSKLIHYLVELLNWYYRFEQNLIIENLVVYKDNVYTSPDVGVVKGVSLTEEEEDELDGWEIDPPHRPAPSVVFEISSKSNWNKDIDLDKNPQKYGELGVKEYFAYDPVGYWRNTNIQLKGWRYENGQPIELEFDEQGRMWSTELASWLVPDSRYLRLYDAQGNQRLTETEFLRNQLQNS